MTDTSLHQYESGNLCGQVNIIVAIKQVVLIYLMVAPKNPALLRETPNRRTV
ncbi:hypothetical protein [Gynuella sp.]|uniref:hypothetical protein n=1 Tax=Gynuella sp. TaxID=2969146 RepID=UPI003D0E0794